MCVILHDLRLLSVPGRRRMSAHAGFHAAGEAICLSTQKKGNRSLHVPLYMKMRPILGACTNAAFVDIFLVGCPWRPTWMPWPSSGVLQHWKVGSLRHQQASFVCGTHSHAQDRHAMCFDGLKMASAHAAVLLHGMSA